MKQHIRLYYAPPHHNGINIVPDTWYAESRSGGGRPVGTTHAEAQAAAQQLWPDAQITTDWLGARSDLTNSPARVRRGVDRIEAPCDARLSDPVHRVYLQDLATPVGPCGYAEGRTREAAIQAALVQAGRYDPNAYYDGRGGCVLYRSCLGAKS